MKNKDSMARRLNSTTRRGNLVKDVIKVQNDMNKGLSLVTFTFDDADKRLVVIKQKEQIEKEMQPDGEN